MFPAPEIVKPVGTRSRIPFPTGSYVGSISKYTFSSQVMEDHYIKLKRILEDHSLKFAMIGSSTYVGEGSYDARWNNPVATAKLTKFVAFVGDPWKSPFVWYKYEGQTAGGGHNHVYVGGEKIKLSDFYNLSANKQNLLFATSKMIVAQ